MCIYGYVQIHDYHKLCAYDIDYVHIWPLLWVDAIPHRLETMVETRRFLGIYVGESNHTMGNYCLLVFAGESNHKPGFSGGPSTIFPCAAGAALSSAPWARALAQPMQRPGLTQVPQCRNLGGPKWNTQPPRKQEDHSGDRNNDPTRRNNNPGGTGIPLVFPGSECFVKTNYKKLPTPASKCTWGAGWLTTPIRFAAGFFCSLLKNLVVVLG